MGYEILLRPVDLQEFFYTFTFLLVHNLPVCECHHRTSRYCDTTSQKSTPKTKSSIIHD